VDLRDPETWKPIAALADYWKSIVSAAAVLVGTIGAILTWGRKPLSWMRSKVPARTVDEKGPIRFVLNEQQSFWSTNVQNTQVSGHWHVTNISERSVTLLAVRMPNLPQPQFSRVSTQALRTIERTFELANPIPPGQMTEALTSLTFIPPISRDEKNPLITDVIFTDNYGDEHRIRNVSFSPLPRPAK
jgi:hypothetical protein